MRPTTPTATTTIVRRPTQLGSRTPSWTSSTESSRSQRENRGDRHIHGRKFRRGMDDGNRSRSRQRGRRTRDSLRNHPRSRSLSRGRWNKHTTRDCAHDERSRSRNDREIRRISITPRNGRGDPRERFHYSRSRSRDGKSPSRTKRGRANTPQRKGDVSKTPKRNRRAYTDEGLRQERERTGGLREAIHSLRRANHGIGHATMPPREDAGRAGTLRGQHPPAHPSGGARNRPAPLVSPHEGGRYGRMRVEAPKTIVQLRQLITAEIRCPVFAESKTREVSFSNSAVMLQDKIARTLNTHELGELRLPRDKQNALGFHIRPDAHTFRRRDLLIGMIGDNVLTHYQLTSSGPVTVITLTDESAVLDPNHVSLSDRLRILVWEQKLVIGSTDIAREAFLAVQIRPGEEWRNVASRLVRSFRAVVADPDRPHASEATFFWSYTTKRQLYELFERVINAVPTNLRDRLSLNALLYDAVARIRREVRSLPIVFHDRWGWTCGRAVK